MATMPPLPPPMMLPSLTPGAPGLLPQSGQIMPAAPQGGLLDGFFQQRAPRLGNFLRDRSSALLSMSLPWLMTNNRDQAFQMSMAGLNQGRQVDYARQKDRREEEQRAQQEAALRKLLASQGLNQDLAGVPGVAGQVLAQSFMPPEPVKPTDDMREFQFAVQNGFKGSFEDWMRIRSPQTSVNVDQRSESEFEKTYGGKLADQAVNILEQGDRAAVVAQKAQLMGRLLDTIQTSRLTPAQTTVGAVAQAIGVNPSILGIDPNLPATAEAINGLANELVVGKIGGPGGFPANNFSEADRNFITSTVPQLSDRPEAAKIKLEVVRRLAVLDVQRAQEWAQARAEGKSYEQFDREWRGKMASVDLFGDLARDAAPLATGAPAAAPMRARNPQTGEVLELRNGQWVPVQ